LKKDLAVVSRSQSFVSFGAKLHHLMTKEGAEREAGVGEGCNLYKGLFLDKLAQMRMFRGIKDVTFHF
jgi:hypothetical protein